MFLVSDFAFKWCIFRLFIDLRTFVAKFLCRDLGTFSADFFVTEKQTPQTYSLLECMPGTAIRSFIDPLTAEK